MKPKVIYCFFFIVFFHWTSASEYREWTDREGRTIEAKLIETHDDGTIRIERSDGWVGSIPLDRLSGKDRQFVELQMKIEKLETAEPELSEDFEIRTIRNTTAPGYISTDEGWELRINCIEVQVRYRGDRDKVGGFVKAYFYDREQRLISKFDEAPRRQESRNGEYIGAFTEFERNRTYSILFPLARVLEDRRWRTVIVVFGNRNEVNVRTRPTIDLMAFEFEEKNRVYPLLTPSVLAALATDEELDDNVNEFLLEMRRPRVRNVSNSVYFNDKWERNSRCLTTEIRSTGHVPSDSLTVKAYFYDQDKRLVETRNKPTMADSGNRVYIEVPVIGRAYQWYPVVFALDGNLASTPWTWSIIVVRSGDQITADIYGPSTATIEDFSFPEKRFL